ncbi:MAG: taurine dioxygenase [Betaproteobacteria bacterium]|nr:taurine dioxygenase [Betaproteobacteria bacterium]
MSENAFTVRKLAPAIGAEISGIDLSRELSDDTVAAIRRAWLEHVVIFFRDQALSASQYLALAERIGVPVEYPFVRGIEGFPVITPVVKLEHERHNFGGVWHSDTTYLETPPMGTLLLAREIPPHGGDTLFANQYLAYDTLSAGMRHTLEGLTGVSSSAKADVSKSREDRVADSPAARAHEVLTAEHPVVRTHPETGRKALYISVAHTSRFKGWSEEESAPLLHYLHQHQIKPEFTCRFQWQVGSIALWDNRAALHFPMNDYHGYRRVMHRITLRGDRPR